MDTKRRPLNSFPITSSHSGFFKDSEGDTVKNCIDCAAHDLHLATLAKTLDAFEQKIDECKMRNHDGRVKISSPRLSSLCVECLVTGFATSKVLSDQILEPTDLQGRRIRDSRSSSTDGGVWPIAEDVQQQAAEERRRQGFWAIALGIFAFLIFLASLATMSIWLAHRGPHF
jgi:hypothetical protein